MFQSSGLEQSSEHQGGSEGFWEHTPLTEGPTTLTQDWGQLCLGKDMILSPSHLGTGYVVTFTFPSYPSVSPVLTVTWTQVPGCIHRSDLKFSQNLLCCPLLLL